MDGNILVPAFVHILGMKEKDARATSIMCTIPTVILSFLLYYRTEIISYSFAIKIAIGGIIGAIIGTELMKKMSEKTLKIIFITFLTYAAFKFIL